MGSSARKKREKKKDFQKQKLKVGKARPKPENQTDTSFRSKAIVLNQQSLQVTAPATSDQFLHDLSLLSSRSDSQRRDALVNIVSLLKGWPNGSPLPQPLSTILHKVVPLLLDGNNGVRQQMRRVLEALTHKGMVDHVKETLPFVRAGMTHLAIEIRLSSLDMLSWLLELAPQEIVSCAGGWTKTLGCFLALLGWQRSPNSEANKWSSNSRVNFGRTSGDSRAQARPLQVLADFLKAGFNDEIGSDQDQDNPRYSCFPIWHLEHHALPTASDPYGYLNLYASPEKKNEETQMLEDAEARIRFFKEAGIATVVEENIASMSKEGGEIGRAAGVLRKIVKGALHSNDTDR